MLITKVPLGQHKHAIPNARFLVVSTTPSLNWSDIDSIMWDTALYLLAAASGVGLLVIFLMVSVFKKHEAFLVQTQKTKKFMPVVIYGSDYWHEIINFDALVKWGMICQEDLDLFHFSDSPEDAFNFLKTELIKAWG